MAKSKTGGRRRAANNKPADRARHVSMPWMRVERGASVERWATLQGLAMLCGPITSRQAADAMGLASNMAAMELKWAAAEGYLVREQNPEWCQWTPTHSLEKPPVRWLWHVGPVPARKEPRPPGGKGRPRKKRP